MKTGGNWVISTDRPGHGLSDPQPDRTLLDWPKDINFLADRLGLDSFHVLGRSAGGPMSFRIADDANTNYKELVRKGYNLCADTYSQDRSVVHERELGLVTERLQAGSSVLDVGCGSGDPVTSYLAARHRVTGVDISASMIALARENVPSARFITGDIMSVDFENNAFNAIVSFYAVFHVPRQEQQELFRRFARWLKTNGMLLVTLASEDDGPGYTEDNFFGVTMYWSNFGIRTYRELITKAGFRIEREGVIGHGYQNCDRPPERHPFVFAVRE